MTTDPLFLAIESPRLSAALNVASDLKTFLRGLERDSSVRELLGLATSEGGQTRIRDRIVELDEAPHDAALEHPSDAAIAAYLTALDKASSPLLQSALSVVARRNNFWWARKVAAICVSGGGGQVYTAMQFPHVGDVFSDGSAEAT